MTITLGGRLVVAVLRIFSAAASVKNGAGWHWLHRSRSLPNRLSPGHGKDSHQILTHRRRPSDAMVTVAPAG